MEIAPGVHQISCTFGGGRIVFCYLLIGERASILIDTGCADNPEQDILPYMAAIGHDPASLTYILNTHSDIDHQGGNAPMKEAAPGALLMCHRLDEPWVADTEALINGRYSQFEDDHGIGYGEAGKQGIREGCLSHALDLTLSGGERLRLDDDWLVEIVHTPGHTWGHLAVFEPRSKTLISGEASIWNAILDARWQPALPPTYCYVDTYLATQERLLAMDIELLAPAHWPLQRGADVAAFFNESRNFCLQAERKLLDLAAQRPEFTLREAIETLGPSLGSWPVENNQDLSYGLSGNLDDLTKRGRLQRGRNDDGLVTWRLG